MDKELDDVRKMMLVFEALYPTYANQVAAEFLVEQMLTTLEQDGAVVVAATATIERLTSGINNLTDALELIPCPNDKLYPNGGNPCACQVFPKERVRHALDAILQAGLALRAAEWAASTRSATDGYSSNYACCPSCGGMKDTALFGYTPGEHRGGCEIASALADPTLAAILKEHDEVERSVK